jgi:branched-chain amino acid aminotransferase
MFDNLQGFIWFDGQILEWRDAKIHVMSHGLHYASSVYEGLRSYNGKLFKAIEHYQRLHESAKFLDFMIPYSPETLIGITQDLLTVGGYKNGYVRAISWCGSKTMKVSHNEADVHVAIGIWERPLIYSERVYIDGIRMNTSVWRRPDPKTAPVHSKAAGLYMTSSMSKKTSELSGFDDALMLDYRGNIAEATSSNIFMVVDGRLFTPTPTCFLNGITRLTCIDIAKKLGIEVVEMEIKPNLLSKASEVFLTGTAIEILPVGSIEYEKELYKFSPGEVTNAIRTQFRNLTENL